MDHFLPDFFVPGAAKSGTTSLHELLNLHPNICMSSLKEPVYWNNPDFHDFNDDQKEWYCNLFQNKNAIIKGESTPSYMLYPNFIENIKSNYPFSPKFIFILRNPIDRAYSHYYWMVGLGLEKDLFENALKKNINIDFKPYDYYPSHYYHFGLYAKWLTQFYNNFEIENIKIITLENLKQNPLKTLNDCFEFLGLTTLENIPEIVSNKTRKLNFPKLFHLNKKMVQGKYKVPKLAKYILSKKGVEFLREKLKKLTLLEKSKEFDYPDISSNQRNLLKHYYLEDFNNLCKLTGMNFSEWEDFKSQK